MVATVTDDWESFVAEFWPKGLETLRAIVKPSAVGRAQLEVIRCRFRSHYPTLVAPTIEDDEIRALLVKAGIQQAPGSESEFLAEFKPGYDFGPERRQKQIYLAAHFGPKDGTRSRKVTTPRLSPADRARRVGGRDVTRLATGIPSLDAATRGGILLRKVGVFGGAPGAGKTALLVRTAYE
ncbi:MAG: hypothetical protein ACRELB_23580, partial [Polyangiaceae bacterium]